MHLGCAYSPPLFGEGGLFSCVWYAQTPPALFLACVPLIGGIPQWHWVQDAPAEVQQALRRLYAVYLEGQEEKAC